jgi:lysine-N-methylase
MTEKKRIVLTPQYYHEFTCIGGQCEDTCCVGWQVNVDKQTYKKYKKVTNTELKPLLEKYVKRIKKNPTDEAYAKIVLDDVKGCPMLTEDKLCKVQLTLGEEYLSKVCLTYPRITNEVNGVLEKSLTTSCPEAARKILLNPQGIEFNELEEDTKTINIVGKTVSTSNKAHINHYFWDLRFFTIQVLQNRDYSIAERLIMLGMFYNKLQEIISNKELHKIQELIKKQASLIHGNAYKEFLGEIPSKVTVQISLLKKIADQRFEGYVQSERYKKCYLAFLKGINFTTEKGVDELAKHYQEAYEKYYAPFMREKEYIFENYLVNYVFKNIFPLAQQEKVFQDYVMMIVHYGLIKMQLIGLAGYYKEQFGLEHVITLIQSFAKAVEHNPLFLRSVLEALKEHGYTSMAYMAVFIKN